MKSFLLAALAALALPSAAQDWSPSRTVRIVVPVLGGTNDLVARLVAPRLQEALGQSVIVENKAGAGGNVGADLVAKSPPDGHTLLIGYNGPIAVNVSLFASLPYDPLKDLAPITLAVTTPQFLTVRHDLPVSSVAELLALARKDPGKLTYASIEIGSASHLTMEMMKSAAGVDILHVPHRGSAPAITALLGGGVDLGFFVPGNVLPHVRAGKLRILAASGEKRFESQPNVPTMMESGFKDFEASAWIGFLAAGGTPRPIIDRYHREIVRILRTAEVRDRLRAVDFEMVASTPEYFADWIRKEIPRWAAIVRQTGAKASN